MTSVRRGAVLAAESVHALAFIEGLITSVNQRFGASSQGARAFPRVWVGNGVDMTRLRSLLRSDIDEVIDHITSPQDPWGDDNGGLQVFAIASYIARLDTLSSQVSVPVLDLISQHHATLSDAIASDMKKLFASDHFEKLSEVLLLVNAQITTISAISEMTKKAYADVKLISRDVQQSSQNVNTTLVDFSEAARAVRELSVDTRQEYQTWVQNLVRVTASLEAAGEREIQINREVALASQALTVILGDMRALTSETGSMTTTLTRLMENTKQTSQSFNEFLATIRDNHDASLRVFKKGMIATLAFGCIGLGVMISTRRRRRYV